MTRCTNHTRWHGSWYFTWKFGWKCCFNGGMGVISTAHPGYRADDFEKSARS